MNFLLNVNPEFFDISTLVNMIVMTRGVTPIRPVWPLARGPEGLGAPKGPLERANVYVRDQDLFWPRAPSLGVMPLIMTRWYVRIT